ncbi:DUF6506 family protein [Anaerococcus jeddahensis]|uniref:DUF6506 family protein n=1 Tax=Anaerococcus jeddahensis TaxID=1673719 RepID=UPI00067236A5|nr:DUF6506 family protein [Anaerococcus jeddahensis]MDU2830701.1 DUF6506 family protein [Anaerococcus sp.]
MKFVYMIMGPFDSKVDRKAIGKNDNTEIIGVKNLEEAKEISKSLIGYADVIELCGAFGKEGAREIIDATNGKIPVGFVTHLDCQYDLFDELFS